MESKFAGPGPHSLYGLKGVTFRRPHILVPMVSLLENLPPPLQTGPINPSNYAKSMTRDNSTVTLVKRSLRKTIK